MPASPGPCQRAQAEGNRWHSCQIILEVTVTANMGIDELTRSYIAKIERQQRAQPTGLFRDRTERAPHFSAGTRFQSTSGGRIQYEESGPWMDGQSISSGSRASPTRLWLQFVSLATLGVLTAYNYIFVLNFLPTRVPREYVASVWLDASEFTWLYGWIVLGMYLLAWAYYWRKKYGYSSETWGAGRDRIRCDSSDWGSCTAHISMDGMDLVGTPSNLVGFPPGTRNRYGLGSCSAGVGFYLLQLRVTRPTPG